MASADALRRRLESLRFRGKWADVKGVAEDNDAIMAGGGFDLASDGDKVMTRVSVPALPAAESFQLSSAALAPSEHAAKSTKHANLVLGAWGCGAFGNPTAPVAALFKKHLASEEFRGAFEHVVFAILDPLGTGNLGPFKQEFGGK